MSDVTADEHAAALPLTVQETAELLRVSDESVRRYIKAGTLTAGRVGRRYLIDRASLAALLSATRPAP
jgi:excisionase family DNA binding protein